MNFWNSLTTFFASADTWLVSAGPTTAQEPPLYFAKRNPMVLSSPSAPTEMRNSHLFLYSVCHNPETKGWINYTKNQTIIKTSCSSVFSHLYTLSLNYCVTCGRRFKQKWGVRTLEGSLFLWSAQKTRYADSHWLCCKNFVTSLAAFYVKEDFSL